MRSSASRRGGSRSKRDVKNGIPAFVIVGLPDRACAEARQRVRSGIIVGRARVPAAAASPSTSRRPGCARRAPATTCRSRSRCSPRRGSCRTTSSTVHASVGELALDGRLRRVGGILAVAEGARRMGLERVLCPTRVRRRGGARGHRADRVPAPRRRGRVPARRARARSARRRRARTRSRRRSPTSPTCADRSARDARSSSPPPARHNLLLAGPPGTGKTMLARRLPGILPPLERRGGARGDAHPLRRRPPAA